MQINRKQNPAFKQPINEGITMKRVSFLAKLWCGMLVAALLMAFVFAQTTPKGLQSDNFATGKHKGGVVLGADHVGGILYPREKPVYGADGSVTDVSIATPMPTLGGLGFALQIAAGNVAGMSSCTIYGRNIEVDSADTADVWDGGQVTSGESQVWLAPTAAAVHNIVSTSGADSIGGGGALTIRLFGLPRWTSEEISEDIIMTGTADVATDCSYVIIHHMMVLTKGATNVNVGIITATATAPSNTTVTALMRVGQGHTQMAILGIPSTQTAYMGRLYANVNKAVGAAGLLDVALLFNPEPQTEILNYRVAHTFGLQTVGTSAFTLSYYAPKVFAGPGIMKVQVISGTNDQDVSAGFEIIVMDN